MGPEGDLKEVALGVEGYQTQEEDQGVEEVQVEEEDPQEPAVEPEELEEQELNRNNPFIRLCRPRTTEAFNKGSQTTWL